MHKNIKLPSVDWFSVGGNVPYSGDISPTDSDVSMGAGVEEGGDEGVSKFSCSRLVGNLSGRTFFGLVAV